MRSARLPRLRGGVCELVMISRVYDDPDEPYGPVSARRALRARLSRTLRVRTRRVLRARLSRTLSGPHQAASSSGPALELRPTGPPHSKEDYKISAITHN